MTENPDVSLAVLTFRRPDGLRKTLESLLAVAERQQSAFCVREIMVVDNDSEGSARSTVEEFAVPLIRYEHEPVPGVAAARNRALSAALGDILVFIDDDEHAGPNWPDGLITAMQRTNAALVGGPVRSILPSSAPRWAISTGFFERPEPPHLTELEWLRSGNLAIDLGQVRRYDLSFEEEFGRTGGEDVRFTVQARRAGLSLRWAADSIVYEDVAADRVTLRWVEDRAANAMTNFVRANAPLNAGATIRIVLRALLRQLHSVVLRSGARVVRDQNLSTVGRIERQRARGALVGLQQARREERNRRQQRRRSNHDHQR